MPFKLLRLVEDDTAALRFDSVPGQWQAVFQAIAKSRGEFTPLIFPRTLRAIPTWGQTAEPTLLP